MMLSQGRVLDREESRGRDAWQASCLYIWSLGRKDGVSDVTIHVLTVAVTRRPTSMLETRTCRQGLKGVTADCSTFSQ